MLLHNATLREKSVANSRATKLPVVQREHILHRPVAVGHPRANSQQRFGVQRLEAG